MNNEFAENVNLKASSLKTIKEKKEIAERPPIKGQYWK